MKGLRQPFSLSALAALFLCLNLAGAASGSSCRPLASFLEMIARSHPSATAHKMDDRARAVYAASTGLRSPETANVIWFERPDAPTVLVAVERDGCVTSARELPKELLDRVVVGTIS